MKYSLSEVAEMFDIPVSTLRYYEKHRLLPFLSRDDSGYYYIEETDITTLHLIRHLKAAGCSVKQIAENVELAERSKEPNESPAQLYQQISRNMSRHLDELLISQKELVDQLQITSYVKWLFDLYSEEGTSALSDDRAYPGHLPEKFQTELPEKIDPVRIIQDFKIKHPNYPVRDEAD